MLFKKDHVELILSGKKTQTRRTWKKRRAVPGRVHKAKREMLSTEYFAKLLILRVWKEKVGDISERDAMKEGFQNAREFLKVFFEINKKKIKPLSDWMEMEVFCIEFELYKIKSFQTRLDNYASVT